MGLQENKQLLHGPRVVVSVVWRIRASRSKTWGSVGPQCRKHPQPHARCPQRAQPLGWTIAEGKCCYNLVINPCGKGFLC